jgi:hypothetical protein
MEKWICTTCGTQFPLSEQPPEACPICSDERQYIGYNGQQWTTLAKLQHDGFRNEFKEHEPGLIGIGTIPTFAIGERALLVQSPHGNILWDCMSLIDEETIAGIERLGALTAIAISHPHYYSTEYVRGGWLIVKQNKAIAGPILAERTGVNRSIVARCGAVGDGGLLQKLV